MIRVYQELKKLQSMSSNKNFKKLNNNKWNPGDVWASVDPIVPNFNNIMELNAWVSKSLEKGYVLPLSLKKVGKKARVILEKYEENPKMAGYRGVKKPRKIFSTGISVITSIKPYMLNFRSFSISHKAHIIGEIVESSGSARHGKTSAADFKKIIKKYHIPQLEQKRIKNLSEDQLKQNVVNLWAQCGYRFSDSAIESDYKKLKIQDWVGYWSSIINALELGAYLNSNKGKANIIVNELYYSAKSLTKFSSDRIKIY